MGDAYYRYVGDGQYVPGVPARDLAQEEAESYGVTKCSLYERVEVKGKRLNEGGGV